VIVAACAAKDCGVTGRAAYGEDMSVQACLSSRLLSRREVAKLLGVAEGTLAHWAAAGTGPAFARSGPVRGRVWYAEADVLAWVHERKQHVPSPGGYASILPGTSEENQKFQ
jgi:predicted DNA-binding transcriptional regulator AlpA